MPQLLIKRTNEATIKLSSKLKDNKNQLKSWWRQQVQRITTKRSNKSFNDASSSSHTTLDWRSLSPDRPPLPFFLPSSSSPTSSTTSLHNDIPATRSIITNNTALNNNTPSTSNRIDNNNIDLSASSSSKNMNNTTLIINNNSNKSIRTNPTITEDRNYQPLCPILEESETMITESTGSNLNIENNSRLTPSSIIMHESLSSNGSSASTSSANAADAVAIVDPSPQQQPRNSNEEKRPLTSVIENDNTNNNDSNISDNSAASFHPPPNTTQQQQSIQNTPSDRYMPDDIVGDEEKCKRKFAKMVLAANKFQAQTKQQDRPSHMALLFDVNGNIDMMRMVRQGKSEYHKFVGNSQYVPPELSINIEYHSELADIWVLGVFLYRMLVGKYPFSAQNDQRLFKKMLHGQFTIPSELSEEAKDLIRRMLAPDMTRASLDLIIYHPWLKSYRPLLLNSASVSATPPALKSTAKIASKLDYFNNNHHALPQQQINLSSSRNSVHAFDTSTTEKPLPPKPSKKKNEGLLRKAILLLVKGPFPPPRKPYRDLSHLGTRDSVFARSNTPAAVM